MTKSTRPRRSTDRAALARGGLLVAAALACTALGCAPRAGVVRPDHPMLSREVGRPPLVTPAPEAAVVFDDAVPDDSAESWAAREHIARIAGSQVGKGPIVVDGQRYRMDCSGVARGIYHKSGYKLGTVRVSGATNDTRILFELVRKSGSLRRRTPLPGDLAFFDNTYDQNRNGLRDDPLSHVAIVEKVEDDGTVVLVHRVRSRIVRARMNLAHPHDRYDDKKRPLNHYLRSASGGEPAKTTAELFVAYGSLPVDEVAARLARR